MINWDLYKGSNIERSKRTYKEFSELLGDVNYKLVGNYINVKIKVELECNKGHRYFVKPYSFKSGQRCPICCGVHSETSKLNFIKQVEKEGYKLVGEYINNSSKVMVECGKGHKYFVRPNDFKSGQRCPRCNINSHGEVLVKKILDEYNCKYEFQKKFDKLIGLGNRQLSYDFFVDDYLLIEVQGIQHFKPTTFGGRSKLESIEAFKYQQEHDRLKREFAKESGYELLEIPYFGAKDLDKLEKVLREKLSKKYLIAS